MVLIKGKLYDRLKYIALIALPAAGAFYFSLAGIWNLPAADKVVGTIVVIDTLLGSLLQLSSSAYKRSDDRFDGTVNIIDTPRKKTYSLDLKDHPDEIEGKKQLVFKVAPAVKPSTRKTAARRRATGDGEAPS